MATWTTSNLHVAFVSHVFQPQKTPEELLIDYFTTVEWVTSISKLGVQVSVIYRYHKDYHITKEGINYYFIADTKASNGTSNPAVFYRGIIPLLQDIGVNVLHVHNIRDVWTNIRLRHWFKHWPIIIQDHGSVFRSNSWKDQLLKPFLKFGLRRLDRVIFAAKGQEENWAKNRIIRNKQCVFIMENSSSFKLKNRETSRNITKMAGQPVFLWVGNLNANKDPLTMLKAFKQILQDWPEARLYMIYRLNEIEEEVKQWVVSKSLEEQITLLGRKNRQELEHYYNSADYFLSASYKEGSGYAAIEAMSCGVVPILTNIPSFVSLTNNGGIGALFEPGNSQMLYEKTLALLKKPLLQEQKRVLAHFHQHFSADAIARQAIQVYHEVSTNYST